MEAKTAEGILKINFGGAIGESNVYITDKNLLISAMREHTRQALEAFRIECAEKAETKFKSNFGVSGDWIVDRDSILSLDLNKYLK